MRIAVLGAGAMGSATARDLVESHRVERVIIGDRDEERLVNLAKRLDSSKVSIRVLDATQPESLRQFLEEVDGLINAAIWHYNLDVMRACLDCRIPYTDLGGFYHMTRRQLGLHEAFVEAGVTAVICCGSSPGTTNVMARYAVDQLDTVREVHIRNGCGEFDERANSSVITVSYNLGVMLDELSTPAYMFSHGEFVEVPPLSGAEEVVFPEPIGVATAYHTRHSEVATMPVVWKEKGIQECTFKLALPAPVVEKLKFLIDLGLASDKPLQLGGSLVTPRDLLSALVARIPQPTGEPNDCDFLKVVVIGTKGGRRVEITMEMAARPHSRWRIGATALDTGIPPSIVMQMTLDGRISSVGVFPPEAVVPPEPYFRELEAREMAVYQTTRWQV